MALLDDALFVPNVGAGVIDGEVIEEVAFVRDEDANQVWAVEKYYFDEAAATRRNRADEFGVASTAERDVFGLTDGMKHAPSYRLKANVAGYWIPYVPRLIGGQGPANDQMYLRRARSLEGASRANPQYRGRLVAESWQLNEEEISRTGVRVQRLWRFARCSDGSERVWVGRRKDPTVREQTSGVEFDYLETRPPVPP